PGAVSRPIGAGPADLEAFRDCPTCPEMIALPAGNFMMGSPSGEAGRDDDEGPQRRVSVPRFAIGKYEVTFEEWDACAADGYCRAVPRGGADDNDTDRGWGRGRRPVIEVSWNDVTGETGDGKRGFLAWLSWKSGQQCRLPSEAEWEYAARAGTSGAFSFGGSDSRLGEHGWFSGNSGGKTQPVGQKAANPWGLHDVHGNVWEWVQDCCHGSYENAPTDGSAWMNANGGDCSRAVVRGGSWSYDPYGLRSAVRIGGDRDYRGSDTGFRVSRTLPAR
ncbi:MAG: formylglycine-generating enzyme family protein, partial [Rhodobacteraceae bacterium]|nr:formylglycine-generating enzyme family protein [Paracoccaceae bacterium]